MGVPVVAVKFDVVPTICVVVGAPLPEKSLCGRSYLPLVLNRPLPRKDPWLSVAFGSLGTVELARDTRYKLVMRKDGEAPSEFYDLKTDSGEVRNQYDNPQFITVRDELYGALVNWRKKYSA